MKIYRVKKVSSLNSSEGFEYFTSKVKAEKALKNFKNQCENERTGFIADQSRIEIINVRITGRQIIQLLNRYGDHPDNG